MGFMPNFAKRKYPTPQNPLVIHENFKIVDGDTVQAASSLYVPEQKYRLEGVDAVESYQEFGDEASNLASSKLAKKDLNNMVIKGEKASGSDRLMFKDEDLAKSLVAKGLGVPDLRYTTSYISEANDAKASKYKIWEKFF